MLEKFGIFLPPRGDGRISTTESKSQLLRTNYLKKLRNTNADPTAIGDFMNAIDRHADVVDQLSREHDRSLYRLRALTLVVTPLEHLSIQRELETFWGRMRTVFEEERLLLPAERWENLEKIFSILEKRETPIKPVKPL